MKKQIGKKNFNQERNVHTLYLYGTDTNAFRVYTYVGCGERYTLLLYNGLSLQQDDARSTSTASSGTAINMILVQAFS